MNIYLHIYFYVSGRATQWTKKTVVGMYPSHTVVSLESNTTTAKVNTNNGNKKKKRKLLFSESSVSGGKHAPLKLFPGGSAILSAGA